MWDFTFIYICLLGQCYDLVTFSCICPLFYITFIISVILSISKSSKVASNFILPRLFAMFSNYLVSADFSTDFYISHP